jgi:hypothetical protein
MAMSRTPAVLIVLAALSAGSLPARADGRAEFVSCQAMVERSVQSANAATAGVQPDEPALVRCRQIIRDWTLRESRMSVDENGRPLR